MIKQIKSYCFIRKLFYTLLVDHKSVRKYKTIPRQLFFNAGKNFNLFFRRFAEIEPQITKNIAYFVKSGSLIFDIGANIGYYTVYLSYLCTEGKVLAVEPDEENLIYLRENVKINNCSNVVIIEKALSNNKGNAKFYIDKSTGRTSSLEHDMWHPNAVEISESLIETITLDNLTEMYGIPSLIKCDVEGHEVSVLKGAENTLKKKPVLFLEVREKNQVEISNLLREFGYKIYNAEVPFNKNLELFKINIPNLICI